MEMTADEEEKEVLEELREDFIDYERELKEKEEKLEVDLEEKELEEEEEVNWCFNSFKILKINILNLFFKGNFWRNEWNTGRNSGNWRGKNLCKSFWKKRTWSVGRCKLKGFKWSIDNK